ncbi:MAG: ATP-binding cassette domain-containing protein [Odoribacter splanchnicus]
MDCGHIYGLLGKNGAGKTKLLKLIGGLLFPLRGRIEVMLFSLRNLLFIRYFFHS